MSLLRAREDGEAVDGQTFDECLRRSVAEVVQQQADAGIDIVSDGEFGKSVSWSRYILERLDGFEDRPDPNRKDSDPHRMLGPRRDTEEFPEFYAEYDRTQGFSGAMRNCICVGPIRYAGQAEVARDIDNLSAAVGGLPVSGFLPVVAPASVAYQRKDEHYESEEAYVYAIADALRSEYTAIIDAGLTLQVDDAHLPMMHDQMIPPASHEDWVRWARLRVDALNHALEGLPEDRTRYHICWGSFNSPHVGDVPFRDIRTRARGPASAYAIEMANPRHEHEWRVWRPRLPGAGAHPRRHQPRHERRQAPRLVCERLVTSRLVGRRRVIAGTDCGFARGPVRPPCAVDHVGEGRSLVGGGAGLTNGLWT